MSSTFRMRRAVAAAVAAAAVAAVSATAADAKVVTVTDDTQADFALGTGFDTVVRQDGAVELARTLEEQFANAAPTGWESWIWPAQAEERAPTVDNGWLVVDGERADSAVPTGPGSRLDFRAILGSQANSHVGFGIDFDADPAWGIFSTGPDGAGKVYARVSSAPGPGDDVDFLVPDINATDAHDYRIDWTETGFVFSVDGNPVVTHAVPLSVAMRPQASNFLAGDGGVSIDSIVLNTHKPSGVFTSRVLDAGDAAVTGVSFDATSAGPAITYETRTADAPNAFADDWEPVVGNAVASPPKQFLQYRAMLSTTVPTATPRLENVEVAFTIDDEPPTVTIQDVAISGATAKVTFSSDDPSADVECSLDGAAFASCTSPAEFGGLAAGSHTIEVRSTDAFDNVGSATRTFDVASPPPPGGSGGGTPPPSGGGVITPTPMVTAVDRSAPKVLVIGRSARVSGRGVATLRVRCPRSEQSCEVAVKLKLGGKTVARKRLEVSGGSTQSFRLQLSKAARRALAARSRLKVTAVVAAEDSAGNRKTTTRRMTLRAPAG